MNNPIFDLENWREIGATLARNKTRTFLTAFGIFWGTAMLSMLWGGASGLEGMMKRNFVGFDTNMGAIFSGRTTMPYKGYNKGLYIPLTDHDIEDIRRTAKYIEASSAITDESVTIAYGSKSLASTAMGVESEFGKIQTPVMYDGRFINDSDVRNVRKVVVLGKNCANELFSGESPLGKFVSINGVYFMVIGVVGQKSDISMGSRLDESAIIPSTTMRRAFNWGNNVGFFMFTAQRGHSPSEIKPYIDRVMRSNHPIHPDDDQAIHMMDMAENFETVDNLFLGISLLAIFVGAGTLMAGIIGIGNIMWIIVKERTQEIGIRRAIGAKPRDIIAQILSEGMLLTSVAGIAGICFATIVLAIVDHVTFDPILGSAHFELHFNHAVTIALVFMSFGTAAGLIPAIKAMHIKPIEAMRDK